jgi:hypothetical protein
MAYSTSSAPLPYVEPYLQDLLGRQQEVANTAYTQSPNAVAGANPYLTAGWNATANRAMQGSPVMSAANQQMQGTIGGQYLNANSNPYLTGQIDAAQGDLARNFNLVNKPGWDTRMSRAGGYNSGVAEMAGNDYGNLAQNMGRIGSDMRFNAYNTERGYQQQAMGMAPQFAQQDYQDANALLNVGAQRQTFDQAGADQNLRWFQEAQAYPQNRLNDYARMIGVGTGSGGTQQQPEPSTASSIAGGAMTGIGLYNLLFGGKP